MYRHKGFTRRDVLRTLAAAVAAPSVVPGSALGAEDKPAAGDRITMGLIGCGNRGSGVFRSLVGQGAQPIAFCDVYKDRRESRAEQYQGADYADFRDLLARDDLDAVLVATPEHWHATHCIEACRQGKDVFCEKPLSFTIEESRAVTDAARRYDRVFQVGTQQRSDARFRFACELVRNGYIGEVKEAFADPGGTSQPCALPGEPVPDGLDWDMWLGPAPWAPYHPDRCVHLRQWWNWRDYSGGLMTDRGAHDFDIVQWGLGMDGTGPVEVFPPDGKEYETLTYVYANGVKLKSGAEGWGAWRGRGASVIFTGTEGKVHVWRGGIETDPPELATVKIKPDELRLYESNNHEANFLQCVRTRQRPVADVAVGASSVNVCHLGNIALWLNRPLKWNPDSLQFPGDEQANRYTWRPMRAPWRLKS